MYAFKKKVLKNEIYQLSVSFVHEKSTKITMFEDFAHCPINISICVVLFIFVEPFFKSFYHGSYFLHPSIFLSKQA